MASVNDQSVMTMAAAFRAKYRMTTTIRTSRLRSTSVRAVEAQAAHKHSALRHVNHAPLGLIRLKLGPDAVLPQLREVPAVPATTLTILRASLAVSMATAEPVEK